MQQEIYHIAWQVIDKKLLHVPRHSLKMTAVSQNVFILSNCMTATGLKQKILSVH